MPPITGKHGRTVFPIGDGRPHRRQTRMSKTLGSDHWAVLSWTAKGSLTEIRTRLQRSEEGTETMRKKLT